MTVNRAASPPRASCKRKRDESDAIAAAVESVRIEGRDGAKRSCKGLRFASTCVIEMSGLGWELASTGVTKVSEWLMRRK